MLSRFESAIQDVGRTFNQPKEISAARDITAEQKVKLLQEWEYDLRLMQVAADEKMTPGKPSSSPELFGRVRACLNALGVPPAEEQGVGPKTG